MDQHKLSVMDVVAGSGPEAVAAVDRLGYKFLAENGYARAKEEPGRAVRRAIRKRLKKRGEQLYCHGHFNGDTGVYSVWFTLRRGEGEVIATSKAVRLQGVAIDAPVPIGEGDEV